MEQLPPPRKLQVWGDGEGDVWTAHVCADNQISRGFHHLHKCALLSAVSAILCC